MNAHFFDFASQNQKNDHSFIILFPAEGGEYLLRQARRGFLANGGPVARRLPFPGSSSANETDYRVY
jgi:hypothetical protein